MFLQTVQDDLATIESVVIIYAVRQPQNPLHSVCSP